MCDDVNTLVKTLDSSDREYKNEKRNPRMNMPYVVLHSLTLACFILDCCVCCAMYPVMNLINNKNVYDKDLQMTSEKEKWISLIN